MIVDMKRRGLDTYLMRYEKNLSSDSVVGLQKKKRNKKY